MGASMARSQRSLLGYAVLTSLLLFASGCASTPTPPSSQLRQLTIGMSRNAVVAALGEPRVVRGAITNRYAQQIEVWEYLFALPNDDSGGEIAGKTALTIITLGMGAATFAPDKRTYWLYFLDGTLARWGEAGDWEKEPARIYEFNFAPEPRLRQ